MQEKVSIFWFRRDLRLDDNVGLLESLKGDLRVLPIFIFDSEILEKLPEDDARVTFIFNTLQDMRKELQEVDSSLAMYHGKPIDIFEDILEKYDIAKVVTNRDYEPYAKERDKEIQDLLKKHEIDFETYKDQVFFEKDEGCIFS